LSDKLSTTRKAYKYCKTNKYTNKMLQVNHGQTTVQSGKTKMRHSFTSEICQI